MKKPNVVLLVTDQQRYDTINKLGYPHMITPNLDRLAFQGCSYINAHSTNPVCMPARHDLITGLPGKAHGYFGNNNRPITDYGIPTLPRIFSENGYRTAAIGKMHFYPPRMHHGFNEMFLMEELPECRQDDQYVSFLAQEGLEDVQNIHGVRPHIYHIPQVAQTDEAHHGSTWVANRTVRWLEENGEQPFFLMCGWIQPHPPWNLPEQYHGLYENRNIPESIPVARNYPDTADESQWFGDNDSDLQKRKIREAYYSAITMVDKNIGTVLDYLEQKNVLDNTLVIFTSDHGEMLQDKGFYSKELPYESSVRIPLIVRYPEKWKPDTINEQFADLFDIMPTCLDICGLEYAGSRYTLPGESLAKCDGSKDRYYQISAYGTGTNRWVMNRNERFKYVYFYNRGKEELFDLENDPGETVNLIENGSFPEEVYIKLKAGTVQYEKQWGPDNVVHGDTLVAMEGELNHPSVHGKFHFWQNVQYQLFDGTEPDTRAARFIKEIQHAVPDPKYSGTELRDVFNNPEWKANFKEHWNWFGNSDDIYPILFDK